MSCPGCQRVADHSSRFRIAALREAVVYLHSHQFWPGWCVLWLKDHAEHLDALPTERQLDLWRDVGDVARAVRAVSGCSRINYENLGNVVNHIHWHLVPRFAAPRDPEPAAPVWVRPKSELESGVTDLERDRLVAAIRSALRG
jgi:diadenosine tetraphosphate (Ap4A) HIT family hydrolase